MHFGFQVLAQVLLQGVARPAVEGFRAVFTPVAAVDGGVLGQFELQVPQFGGGEVAVAFRVVLRYFVDAGGCLLAGKHGVFELWQRSGVGAFGVPDG